MATNLIHVNGICCLP